MQSLDKLKLEYERNVKRIKQIDNKVHAVEKKKRVESKYGHKDTSDFDREIRQLHNEKRNLIKMNQKIVKKMEKIKKKGNS